MPASPQYTAVLTDIDGTLAPYGVPPSAAVVAGLAAVAERCHVGLISSRDFHYVNAMAARFGLTGPQVADGGARIFRAETLETLDCIFLEREDAQTLLDAVAQTDYTFSAVDDTSVVEAVADIRHWRITRVTVLPVPTADLPRFEELFGPERPVHVTRFPYEPGRTWGVDVTHKLGTKATAVHRYARLIGTTPARIIGIGDGPNDVEFLQECGLRIAMGNAHPDLKAIAHWIAPDVTEHGILAALERYGGELG
ncbi:MAG: HAD family phosphatase [Chloroflexi bacterium]|nr:HAD family phosphatase [Chloroflexota bacterium]